MSSIKGIIFDYGGTIDTDGIHWGELIWEEYQAAGIGVDKSTYRDAYVHGERSLAKAPIIATSFYHVLVGLARYNVPKCESSVRNTERSAAGTREAPLNDFHLFILSQPPG